jgi:hypothetical protein
MQLQLIFPPIFVPKLPPLMEQMHVNKVRHLLNDGQITLVGRSRLELGKTRIRWTRTGDIQLIEVVKTQNC